jgi:hypothetical protein
MAKLDESKKDYTERNRVTQGKSKNDLIESPQSQSFFQGYRSNLPISLTYFIPKTKGYEP